MLDQRSQIFPIHNEEISVGLFPEEKTVIVTGAASPRGIGRATAMHLAAEGWNIGIIDLGAEACTTLAAEIRETYDVQAAGAAANVADEASVRGAIDELESAGVAVASSVHKRKPGPPLMTSIGNLPKAYS